ncbi:MAG: tetratricopeptide repeat protein, partial [Proteobacteria bacterium]|nr:tetratricopeptide repeat protein [Pseudomonadota bacterium]
IKPDYAEAHTNLGLAYHQKKELILATNAFTRALSIKPDLGEALFGLALVYRDQNEYKKAMDYAQKAIKSGKKVSPVFMKKLQEKVSQISP